MTSTPRTIHTGIEGLLAVIPHTVGFRPTDSAVAVSLRANGQVGLVARVDLDTLTDRQDGMATSLALVDYLLRDGAQNAALVIYTDTDPRPIGGHRPDMRVALALTTFRAGAEGTFDELPVWIVTPTGWMNFDCTDSTCCPDGGRPLSHLDSSEVAAESVLRGSAPLPSRQDVGAIPAAPAKARETTLGAYTAWTARRDAATSVTRQQKWRLESVAAWRAAAVMSTPNPALIGRVAAGLMDLRVRDAVLTALVPGTGRTAEDSVRGASVAREADQALAAALDQIISPTHGVQPGPEVQDEVTALEQVVAHAPQEAAAPVLTLLALLAWWAGNGARAAVLVGRALDVDPEYRLALLINDAVDKAVPPGWVRRDQDAEALLG